MHEKIRIGISRCLLGERVRYDGQHKLDAFLVETLGSFVEYVGVCPEVECGLPVPREAMRLVGTAEAPRLVTQRTGRDLTEMMMAWVTRRLDELEREDLCGFIFKAKSPSSGMERVKIYNADGAVIASGAGLFAAAFMKRFPLLPVEDEGRLHDVDLRENFIERIFALSRYRAAMAADPTVKGLMEFHARHKLLIMAHSETHMRSMGRLLAGARRTDAAAMRASYEAGLLAGLRLQATVRKHVNVLQHMAGYFREFLAPDEKRELQEVIEQFRIELLPLIVPVTLIRHYARKYDVPYLKNQYYLEPHPLELKLRNHA